MCIALFFILLLSCTQKTLDDYREEGEKTTRTLILELKNIHSQDDLLKARQRLQKLFNSLVDTMIAAKEYQQTHQDSFELSKKNHDLSEKLRYELIRIYKINGCRELMEKYQDQALQRLVYYNK